MFYISTGDSAGFTITIKLHTLPYSSFLDVGMVSLPCLVAFFLDSIPIHNYTCLFENFFALIHFLQASGRPLPPLALDLLPVVSFPLLPLMTTRQCSLEGDNQDRVESVTAISWTLSQWYAGLQCAHNTVKVNTHSISITAFTTGVDQIRVAKRSFLANEEIRSCRLLPQLWRGERSAAGYWRSG